MSNSVAREFEAAFYLKAYPDVANSAIDPLKHYLTHGWKEGRRPTSWFDPTRYAKENPHLDPKQENLFLHLIEKGDTAVAEEKHKTLRLERELALPFFDADYYVQNNPFVKELRVDPLTHFLTIGWMEGRNPSAQFSLNYYIENNHDVRNGAGNPFIHYCKSGHKETWRKTASVLAEKVLQEFSENKALKQALNEAVKIEPMVAQPLGQRTVNHPFDKRILASTAKTIRQSFATKTYRYVVLLPHMRMSGAARVAAIFTKHLADLRQPEKILLLVTDSSEREFSHWFDERVDIFDLNVTLSDLKGNQRQQCLYDLLYGVCAECIININSRLGWEMISTYSRQFSQDFKLLTYLFTWDEHPSGAWRGYPIEWLNSTLHTHDVIITDNKKLARYVNARLGLHLVSTGTEVVTLYTPPELLELQTSAPRHKAGRPRFLWAGRFDRQKRTDILFEIAKNNPEIDVDIYGKEILDKGLVKEGSIPANCYLKGIYKDVRYIFDVVEYDGFIYTAQWDGIPTILLDVAQAQLPIIAPDVGGVSELITSETGWLVGKCDDVAGYTDSIQALLRDTQEARRRAVSLQRHVERQFSESDFRGNLEKVLNRHGL